jgi:hypothetical protein
MSQDPLRLVATWTTHKIMYRLLHGDHGYVLERCTRNTPGLELWECARHTNGLGDGGVTAALCNAIEQFAGLRPPSKKLKEGR